MSAGRAVSAFLETALPMGRVDVQKKDGQASNDLPVAANHHVTNYGVIVKLLTVKVPGPPSMATPLA